MTNREKYAQEILDLACKGNGSFSLKDGKIVSCVDTSCADCIFIKGRTKNSGTCEAVKERWSKMEYIEPPIDWSNVAVDTPILVRDAKDDEWEPRHFARCENGEVYAWDGGLTSWSAGGDASKWEYAKLAESEE